LRFEQILQAAALAGVEVILFPVRRSCYARSVRIRRGSLHDEDVIQPDVEDVGGRRDNLQIRPAYAIGLRQAVERPHVHRQPEAHGELLLQVAHAQVLIVQQVAQPRVDQDAHRPPPRSVTDIEVSCLQYNEGGNHGAEALQISATR